MFSMKFTCITATYNSVSAGRGQLIERCISSVASIKTPHEHLIMDGGSTDGTVDLLNDMSEKYPNVRCFSEKDKGLYDALNNGIAHASGEWLYVLGDDDYVFAPSVLDKLLQKIDGYDFVATRVIRGASTAYMRNFFAFRRFFTGMVYCHQGVLIRTELARTAGGFNLHYKVSADYDLCLRIHLSHKCKFKYFSDRFAHMNPGGMSEGPQATLGHEENLKARQESFGLSDLETALLKYKHILPLRVLSRFLFCGRLELMLGAWSLLFPSIAFRVKRAIRIQDSVPDSWR